MKYILSLVIVGQLLVNGTATAGKPFYDDPKGVVVEREGQVIARLPAERITLKYPELGGRAEVNMAVDSHGTVWAAVGYMTGRPGVERLFQSKDGGKTWTSRRLEPTRRGHFVAFTVLADDSMLLVLQSKDYSRLEVFGSKNAGQSWQRLLKLLASPFEQIGEGFLSLTQLKDGTILLPVCRWNKAPEGQAPRFPQYVLLSRDGGRSWQDGIPKDPNVMPVGTEAASRWPGVGGTFPGCCETQFLELANGRLLAAFRYSGYPRPWHKKMLKAWGGSAKPDGIGRMFKHVFLGDSADGGKTWRNLRPLRDPQRQPVLIFGECHGQLVQLPDGRVVLVHDHRYPYEKAEVIARVSTDSGQTWQPQAYHLSFGMGYPASVALSDGTIVTVTGNLPLKPNKDPARSPSVQVIRWRLPAA